MSLERTPEQNQKLESHRFILSKEKFAKDRIKGIREAFKEFRVEHPEVLSFNFYGSMSKGNPSIDSDVDGIIFIDEELLSDYQDFKLEEFKKNIDVDFRRKLAEKFNVAEDIVMSKSFTLSVVSLSQKFIDNNINRSKEAFERLEKWKEQNPDWADIEPGWAMWSRVFDGNICCWNVLLMFQGIAVGRDIDKYRKYVLRKLKDMGEAGEKIWQMGMRIIRTYERADMLDDKIKSNPISASIIYKEEFKNLYPQTIDEAFRYYHFSNSK